MIGAEPDSPTYHQLLAIANTSGFNLAMAARSEGESDPEQDVAGQGQQVPLKRRATKLDGGWRQDEMDDLLNPAILPKLWGDAAVEALAKRGHIAAGQVMDDPHSKATAPQQRHVRVSWRSPRRWRRMAGPWRTQLPTSKRTRRRRHEISGNVHRLHRHI